MQYVSCATVSFKIWIFQFNELIVKNKLMIALLINPLECVFFSLEGCETLDREPGPGYNSLLLRLIPRDLYIACLH